MNGTTNMEDFSKISQMYSYLGNRFISGDVEVAKFLYGNAWKESPPLVKTIGLLQDCLTAVEIENDTKGIYCDEFLYYWAMICTGEMSTLIFKDLGTAEICFKKIAKIEPKANARLAFIKLLQSDEPAKSERNIARIEVLRKWAGKQDLFSRIILSRITFYQFLDENQADPSELPFKALQLLEVPCQKGHPIAIRFWNEILDYIGTPTAINLRKDIACVSNESLYDYKTPANMQTWR